MRCKTAFFPIVMMFAALVSSAYAYYPLIDLGPGYANYINNQNQIVGTYYIYDPTGQGNNIDFETFYNGYSIASCINDNGQIVGTAYMPFLGYSRAYTFDSTDGSALKDLGTLRGNSSGAFFINNSGQIVGSSIEGGACLYDSTGNKQNISLGLNDSWADAINDSGRIVGINGSINGNHACIFDPTGGGENIDLGTLGGEHSQALSINNNGQIVGYADTATPFVSHACLFDPTGSGANIDLGTIDGYNKALAHSINNKGQIVGFVGGDETSHACLFDPTGQGNNIDLNKLIDPKRGLTLIQASCINDNDWIVGFAEDTSGNPHAYLLKANTEAFFSGVHIYSYKEKITEYSKVDPNTAEWEKSIRTINGYLVIERIGASEVNAWTVETQTKKGEDGKTHKYATCQGPETWDFNEVKINGKKTWIISSNSAQEHILLTGETKTVQVQPAKRTAALKLAGISSWNRKEEPLQRVGSSIISLTWQSKFTAEVVSEGYNDRNAKEWLLGYLESKRYILVPK